MNESFINKMNLLGRERHPFLFIIDFELTKPLIFPMEETLKNDILFNVNGIKNYDWQMQINQQLTLMKFPLKYRQYKKSFDQVMSHLRYGNSFLTNLTFPTEIHTKLSLKEIFFLAKAP